MSWGGCGRPRSRAFYGVFASALTEHNLCAVVGQLFAKKKDAVGWLELVLLDRYLQQPQRDDAVLVRFSVFYSYARSFSAQTDTMQLGGWNSFSWRGTYSSLNVTMPCWSGAPFCEAMLGAFQPHILASSASRPVFKSTTTLQRSSTRASWLCSGSAKQKRYRTSMCS